MAPHILRLRRTDNSERHLLLHVTSPPGSISLDLKLVGTEHEHLYHASIQDGSVKSLQSSAYEGDLGEWKSILRFALLHEVPEGSLPEALQGIETVAAISGTTLTVTIRKNIGGIAKRLGAIRLAQDDEREEVGAFEWVDAAVASGDELRGQLHALQASVNKQQDEVAGLNRQLDELVQAKREHEDALLKKFALLLNAKKLKIRDQQRLLAGAKVDPRVAQEVSSARASGKGRVAGSSRAGKRKDAEADEHNGETDDEAAFEENDDANRETPQQIDDEATESEDDQDVAPKKERGNVRPDPKKGVSEDGSAMEVDMEEPPPRRELPFQRRQAKAPAPAAPIHEDDDETDDEL